MKRSRLAISLFSVAIFTVPLGCKEQTKEPAVGDNRPPVELDQVKKETREAVDAAKDYTYAQKAEYTAKIRAEIADLNKELDQLSTKIETTTEPARAEAKAKLQDVRDKVSRLSASLDGVQSATESTWDEVKAGVRKGYEEVKISFKQARQWLSEKIAP